MFKVSDLDPDYIANYSPDDIYSDIEILMENEQIVAYYLQQIKEGKDIKWKEIEDNINLDKYDEVIVSLINEWGVKGLRTIKDATYTVISASLKSAQEAQEAEERQRGADKKHDVEYIIKQFDEFFRNIHNQNMNVLRSYLPPARSGWWTEENAYAQLVSDIGKMYHDLATVMTYILYEIKDLEKLNPYKDIIDELSNIFSEVKLYTTGSAINLQANTGHTVKIITTQNKIVGHLGDHAPIPDIDAKYKKILNRNKEKMKEFIKIVASIIEKEQIIRNNLVDIDYYINVLYEEADTDDSDIVLEMIQSGENENLQYNYAKLEESVNTIKIVWDDMLEYAIELQKYLAEPIKIKYEHWFESLPTSSFSHLIREIQYFDLL
ncbi:MAG: hypothetical protein QXK74_07415 [Candidatus Nitrosocaldaceae archaeon]